MLQLTKDDIYLNQQAENKQDAIKKIADALTKNQFVEDGYVNGMLERESQAATYLGSGIAIPHGTTTTRHLVKKTGVQVFYFPQGVVWGDDGEKAYIAIGIAASSDEHLTLLRQLTHVLGDEDVEDRIKQIQSVDDVIALLTGQASNTEDHSNMTIDDSLLLLDIPSDNLSTLQALNASRLKRIGAVSTDFIVDTLDNQPNYLGQGIWLNDSTNGNLKNAIAISRTNSNITELDKPVKLLITIAAKNDAINNIIDRLACLAFNHQLEQLVTANKDQLIQILINDNQILQNPISDNGQQSDSSLESDTLSQEFTVLNPHGLHTRPASVLVKIVKEFNSKITVANLDGTGTAVSATSLMKLVALGAKKGSRLQFIATGDDAQNALNAIGKAIAEGLGEGAQ